VSNEDWEELHKLFRGLRLFVDFLFHILHVKEAHLDVFLKCSALNAHEEINKNRAGEYLKSSRYALHMGNLG
jgi:hypothetical protein